MSGGCSRWGLTKENRQEMKAIFLQPCAQAPGHLLEPREGWAAGQGLVVAKGVGWERRAST